MAEKQYKCGNSPDCDLARTGEWIKIDDSGLFSCESGRYYKCPLKNKDCQTEHLKEIVKPKQGFKIPLPILIGAPVVIVLMILGVSLGKMGDKTDAAKKKAIAAELKKIWPWLSP